MYLSVLAFAPIIALVTAFPDKFKGDNLENIGGLSTKTSTGIEARYENDDSKIKVRPYVGQVERRFFHLWGEGSKERNGESMSEEDCNDGGDHQYFQQSQIPAIMGGGHQHPFEMGKAAPLQQNHGHQVVAVFRRIPIPVPQPYPVEVIKHIPIPVPHPLPYLVHRPYPVYISRPYPVAIPKPYPYPVERRVLYPVYVPQKVPIPHPYHVHVPRWVPFYVHVPVSVPMPHSSVLEKVPAFAHFSGGEGQGRKEGGSEGENEKGKGGDHGDERD